MNLNKLKEAIEQYKNGFSNNTLRTQLWKWEAQRIFQENWDANAFDFGKMYDASLQNSVTNRLWRRENYFPKDVMVKLIEMNHEFVRQAFADLYNEGKDIDGKMNRFIFHCDQLLQEYRELHPGTKVNSHFHDDEYQINSIYLAFRYPMTYTPYHFSAFSKFMEKLGSRDVPKLNDVERFFKVMRTVYGFLVRDEALVALHQSRLDPGVHYTQDSLLLVEDFYLQISGLTTPV